jgi:drug/metabolite transporter (DMT)-like permease
MLTITRRRRYAIALIGAAAAWGTATAIAKSALVEIPPLTLLAVQLGASMLLIGPIALARRRSEPKSPQLPRLVALGILNPGISYALGLIGLTFITASESVLLWAIEPIMIMALAVALLKERVTGIQVAAAFIATIGVVLVVSAPGNSRHPVGIALTLAAVAACAVYTVFSRKWMISESSLQVVTLQQAAALTFAVALLAIATAMGEYQPQGIISIGAWTSAVISGCLYYGIAFWLYLTGLRHTPASSAGQYINLIPVFGIAVSRILLDEQLTTIQWFGAVIIVAAVAVYTTRVKRATIE